MTIEGWTRSVVRHRRLVLAVYRFREEMRGTTSKEDAVVRTMQTAGRTVVFSGTAVGLGLALLLFMPLVPKQDP